MKVHEAVEFFLAYHRSNSQINTLRSYEFLLSKFEDFFGDGDLEEISSEGVLSFLTQRFSRRPCTYIYAKSVDVTMKVSIPRPRLHAEEVAPSGQLNRRGGVYSRPGGRDESRPYGSDNGSMIGRPPVAPTLPGKGAASSAPTCNALISCAL